MIHRIYIDKTYRVSLGLRGILIYAQVYIDQVAGILALN